MAIFDYIIVVEYLLTMAVGIAIVGYLCYRGFVELNEWAG